MKVIKIDPKSMVVMISKIFIWICTIQIIVENEILLRQREIENTILELRYWIELDMMYSKNWRNFIYVCW